MLSRAKPLYIGQHARSTKSPAKSAKTAIAAKPLKKGDHVFLVDGSGYIFRAYHALPPINRKSDGLQLNAVFGFCNMLWKLLRDMKAEDKPTHLAVVFDLSEHTFRTEMYPDYKAHRPDPPDDLRPQFPLIRDAVHAFDLPCLEQKGFEADDLIATYVRQACEAGATATIVSSDKDLMQLVNDGVIMFDTMKDKKIGRAEVIEKFGVPPEKVIEVQALIGNSTDNVPGVPGIGVKTAAQLIGEYGDLETLLRRATEIKQDKRRQSLIENADKARLSKKLVTLDDHVKLDVPIGDLAVHEPDYKRLIAFLRAMEFSSLTRRVAEFASIDPSDIEPDAKLAVHGGTASPSPVSGEDGEARRAAPSEGTSAERLPLTRPAAPADLSREGRGKDATDALTPQRLAAARLEIAHQQKFDRSKYETVRSLDRLKAWIARAREQGFVAIDTETSSLDPMQAQLCGFSLALAPNEACYVPLSHRQGGDGNGGLFQGAIAPDQIAERAALDAMKALLEDTGVLKIGQNLKFDWQIFAVRGIEIASYDDTMLMSYVVDAGRSDHGLDPLARRYFDHQTIDFNEVTKAGKTKVTFDCVEIDKATEYAAEDADVTLRLWQVLKPRLAGRACAERLRDAGAAARSRARGYGAARHFDRPQGAVAAVRRIRPGSGRSRSRDQQACRRAGQCRLTEADRRHSVRQDATARRHQDQDRPMGDRRAVARRACRAGPQAAAKNPRLAAGVEAEIDLHRRAARLRQSDDAPGPYQLRARRDHDRAAVVVGA